MEKRERKSKNILYILLIVNFILIISFSSFAYFSFKKVYEGGGDLPILNINYSITKGVEGNLKNIYYNGQSNNEVEVTLNSNGNNISGYVRVKVAIIWSGSMSNKTYNTNGELIDACKIEYDDSIWEYKNSFYYLRNTIEKDSNVVLFSNILFDSLPDDYRGNKVNISIFCEIYQLTNLPDNW